MGNEFSVGSEVLHISAQCVFVVLLRAKGVYRAQRYKYVNIHMYMYTYVGSKSSISLGFAGC